MRPSLAKVQAAFQQAILAADDAAPPAILDGFAPPPRGDQGPNFAAYRDGYRLRLAEFLANDFPVLRGEMGDENFGALVEDYIAATPSRFRNARWFGARLPEFLASAPRWREDAARRDLARFERALSDAFDAADAPTLGVEALHELPQEDWPRLVVAFHPSLHALDLVGGTLARHQASAAGEQAGAETQARETVVVWRADPEVLCRALDEDERIMLTRAMAGAAFDELCGLLAFRAPENVALRAGALLAGWFAQGWISALSVAR